MGLVVVVMAVHVETKRLRVLERGKVKVVRCERRKRESGGK